MASLFRDRRRAGTFVNYDGTRATADQNAGAFRVKVEHSPVIRSYEVILPSNAPPRQVILTGKPLIQLDDSGYRSRKQGWWMEAAEGTLHVLFAADDFVLDVTRR